MMLEDDLILNEYILFPVPCCARIQSKQKIFYFLLIDVYWGLEALHLYVGFNGSTNAFLTTDGQYALHAVLALMIRLHFLSILRTWIITGVLVYKMLHSRKTNSTSSYSYLRTRFVYSICFVSTFRKHSMFCCLMGLRVKQGGLFWISRWASISFLPVLLAVGMHHGLEVLIVFAEI